MIYPYIQTKTKKASLERGKVTIGRHADCSIVIDDVMSSRNHCVVERVGRDYVLRDLDSRNGTRVNGELVTSIVLAPNDVITIGQTNMTFIVPKEAVEHVEVLSDDDLVEVEPEDNEVVPYIPKDEDYEVGMEKLADALPDHIFDEYDVETVAVLREHLRLPGMGHTATLRFRDKLAMRQITQAAGINVPDFTPILNYDRLRDFMDAVPAPWVLKPRTEAGAMGIKRMHHSEELWRALDVLGARDAVQPRAAVALDP